MSKPVIKALVIDPDAPAGSAVREIDQELSTFQQLVGGYIEGVYGLDDDGDAQVTIFINEEGKIYGLPVNRIATLIWYHLEPEVRGHDVLCGTAVIVGGTDPTGAHHLPVPDDVVAVYEQLTNPAAAHEVP